jgi:hypothetical protein
MHRLTATGRVRHRYPQRREGQDDMITDQILAAALSQLTARVCSLNARLDQLEAAQRDAQQWTDFVLAHRDALDLGRP